jgi:3-deoxy-D-manno-oct-2-ulosonic acid (Kdo) hydroxylase
MDLIAVRDFEGPEDAPASRISEDRARWYCERLEDGNILFFPKTPFHLAHEEIEFLLGQRQVDAGYHKNIAYRPSQDRLSGFVKRGAEEERMLRAIMRSYSRLVTGFLSELLPYYAASWRVDLTSFRPFEEKERDLRVRARNDLLHIDAFPTRPTNGDRILRVFTNINPGESRVWNTSDNFEALAKRFAWAARFPVPRRGDRWPWAWLRPLLSGAARKVGFHLVERSLYDRCMLRFHHYLKHNHQFQQGCPKQRWEFPPSSSWILFTDMVSHAVLSGQFALEQTLIVSRGSLVLPEKAPVSILENLFGVSLTHTQKE